jgi:phosphatidylglycerophosphatase A
MFSVYVSGEAERIFREKDAQQIVIDEIAGIQWTMLFITPTLIHVAAGFILFRLFDIAKPFPVNLCQSRLPGGWGVVGDDVAAGIYGLILMHIITYYGV